MGLLFIAGIAPFLWAMLPDMQAEGDFFTSGGGFADIFSADLIGYLAADPAASLAGGNGWLGWPSPTTRPSRFSSAIRP